MGIICLLSYCNVRITYVAIFVCVCKYVRIAMAPDRDRDIVRDGDVNEDIFFFAGMYVQPNVTIGWYDWLIEFYVYAALFVCVCPHVDKQSLDA